MNSGASVVAACIIAIIPASALHAATATQVACDVSTPTATVTCEGRQVAICDVWPAGIQGRCLTPRGVSAEARTEFALGQILDRSDAGIDLTAEFVRRVVAAGRVALAGGGVRTFKLPEEAAEGAAGTDSAAAGDAAAGSAARPFVCRACPPEGPCQEGAGASRTAAVREVTTKIDKICKGFPDCLRPYWAGLKCEVH
jgi:hypothetical protein